MSERDSNNMNRWNVYSLKEYFDVVIDKLDEKIEQRFASVKEAVTKAEAATERRFEGVNEFRNTLSDQQRTFLPRKEYEATMSSIDSKINEVGKKVDKLDSMKAGGKDVWVYIVAVASLIFGIASIAISIITHK